MSHCTLTFTHLTFFPESLISGRGQGSKYADAWLQIWRVECRDFVEIYHPWEIPPFDWVFLKQFYPKFHSDLRWGCIRSRRDPVAAMWAMLRPVTSGPARICQLLNGFFLAGSFCVMEWGKQFCFLFATLLCEFVLLFRAFLYLFHGGWFVQFNFSVFL